VPINGYYEWHHGEKEKYPHFIFPRYDKVFLLAGIYEQWTDPVADECLETFSIITTAANERMSWIHNSKKRMPAILSLADAKRWLDREVPFADKKDMLKPYSQEQMADHTISRLITSRKENPNCERVMLPHVYPELVPEAR
jgi:putative SOS response-associated peptidase YedK